jgi:hypothetical protein
MATKSDRGDSSHHALSADAPVDLTRSFLNRASELALAAKRLGQRINSHKRIVPTLRSAPEQGPRPPEPETSQLLHAVRALDPLFRQVVSDPVLYSVKEALKRLGRLINQCLPLQRYDYNQPFWVSGCAFYNDGIALEEAITAMPRSEPAYVSWDEGEAHSQYVESQAHVILPAPYTPANANELTSVMVNESRIQAAATEEPEEFLEFSTKQRKLLKALYHKDRVPFAALKQAVYGTELAKTSALEQLKSRTNEKLAERNYPFEIKREANTFLLSDI